VEREVIMRSKEDAKTALKKLSRVSPSEDEFQVIVSSLAHENNDRSIVIIAAAMLEQTLEDLLLGEFRTLTTDERKRLFEGEAPLTSFSAKIKMAYALNLIDRKTTTELDLIRDLRNSFAHARKPISFYTEEVADVCQHLKFTVGLGIKDKFSGKLPFLTSWSSLFGNLLRIKSERAHRKSLVKALLKGSEKEGAAT